MGWTARLNQLVPDLSVALARFPVSAAISLVLCIWLNLSGAADDEGMRMVLALSAAFIASGAAHLHAEASGVSRVTSLAFALVVAITVGLVALLPKIFRTNDLFLFAGLLPVLMLSPFLRAGVQQGAIWLFNLRLGLAALLAFVVALLFALGLSALIEALDVLFHAALGSWHDNVWQVAAALVAPLYGLSLIPRKLDEAVDIGQQRGSLLDRGISVLVNYVAVPVIAAYALILHAYAVKIVVDGALPEGQIATMVTSFAIGGTAVWLVAWPWREEGTRLLRLFMRSWFFLLIVPAVLLVIAVWRRLSDYGVTPDRYGIALVALWVAALVCYLAVRRNRADMRAILGAVAVLLLLASVGPWGASGLTIMSQVSRLAALLGTHGVLAGGKIDPKGLLPPEAASEGSSIVYALKDVNGLDRLQPWFTGTARNPFDTAASEWELAQAVNERLGFAQASLSADYVNFNANMAATFETAPGARVTGPFTALQRFANSPPQKPMSASFDTSVVTVMLEDETFTIAQAKLLDEAKRRLSGNAQMQGPIAIELAPGVTLLVDQVFGNLAAAQPLSSLRFWIIRQPRP